MRSESWLIVFEFPPNEHEWQLRDLGEALLRTGRHRIVRYCHGFIKQYRPGGLKPLRLANGVVVHGRTFVSILLGRFDMVLVRTAPPLIQMTVAVACRLRGVPYSVWLMDAHPELEAEIWAGVPVVGWLARRLARANARYLERARFIIVLDEAMRRRLVAGLSADRVILCPTWGAHRPQVRGGMSSPEKSSQSLRFVYLGNLGMAHDLPLLGRFLLACAKHRAVEISFFGTAKNGIDVVARAVAGSGITWKSAPAIPFEQLHLVLTEHRYDFGLVTLNAAFSGLLSPSKFIGYLVAGLPLVCLGPEGNNSADVCDRFGAGLRLESADMDAGVFAKHIQNLCDPGQRENMRRNAVTALQFFNQFDGSFLAAEIDARLRA
jgi:hypothetical protein